VDELEKKHIGWTQKMEFLMRSHKWKLLFLYLEDHMAKGLSVFGKKKNLRNLKNFVTNPSPSMPSLKKNAETEG
jgi:hypothetical protein